MSGSFDYEVFLSHSSKDKVVVRELAERLKADGIRVWFDEWIIKPGDSISKMIEDGLETSRSLIFFMSANAFGSDWVSLERHTSIFRAQTDKSRRFIPLMLEDTEIKAMIKHIAYIDWRQKSDEQYQMLLDVCRPPQPEPAPQVSVPAKNTGILNNIPYNAKGDRVINRKTNLDRLHAQLLKGHTAIGHAASFQGIGGLGKTQLAVEYAHEYMKEYPDGVFWFNADQEMKLQIIALGKDVGWIPPETDPKLVLDIALHSLRSCNDCLLIFDNVEKLAAIKPYIPLRKPRTHILITSRTPQAGFDDIELETLDTASSMRLLCMEAERTPQDAEQEKAAQEILVILGGLPLALELAGAYLRERKLVSFSDYLTKLSADPVNALRYKKLLSFTRHDADLYSTLRVNKELFDEEDGPLLRDILDLLTWSGPAHMGLALMGRLLGKEEPELRAALSIGYNYRLLYKEQNAERYSIHRLVREVRRIESPIADRAGWVDDICRKMGDWFEGLRKEFNNLTVFEEEIDHLKAWLDNAQKYSPSHVCRFIWLQAYPAYYHGLYQDAHDRISDAINLSDTCPVDDILKANLYNDFGVTYRELGEFKKSREYCEKALEIRRKELGEEHPDTAMSYSNICAAFSKLGEHKKALEYEKKALEIRRMKLGEDHPDTATSYNNIGITFSMLGEHEVALEYYEKALKINLKMLGEDHPATATSYINIDATYSKLGEHKKSLEYGMKAIKINIKMLGEDHSATATSYNNIGVTYSKLGKYEIALDNISKALNIWRKRLGEDHADTGRAYASLGYIYAKLHKPNEAMQNLRKGVAILEAKLGKNHEDTIHYRNILNSLSKKPIKKGFRQPKKRG